MSIWEAFSYASAGVRQWFERNGQLATERPLLDDNGDGAGREAQNPGPDGALARAIYLAPESTDTASNDLLKRRAELERQLDDLQAAQGLVSGSGAVRRRDREGPRRDRPPVARDQRKTLTRTVPPRY